MSESTVIITEKDGSYQIQNNGMSDFVLIGVLESIVFDLKKVNRRADAVAYNDTKIKEENIKEETAKESVKETPILESADLSELRSRIGNALKAIKTLGGEVTDFDIDGATEEELQAELGALTDQYKRLKNSKSK
jgi:hypothetical protein